MFHYRTTIQPINLPKSSFGPYTNIYNLYVQLF